MAEEKWVDVGSAEERRKHPLSAVRAEDMERIVRGGRQAHALAADE